MNISNLLRPVWRCIMKEMVQKSSNANYVRRANAIWMAV